MKGSTPLARFTVHVTADMGERLKNAAHARGFTVAEFCVLALTDRTVSAETDWNGGQPFPARPTLAERVTNGRNNPAA